MRIERELLDLVNGDDVVIGTVYRDNYQDIVEGNLGYIRVSEMFILNAEGNIWTPVRTATKKIAPSGYDYGAAGHVGCGDSYVEAMISEAQEEVNLSITANDLGFVTKIRTDKGKIFRS